MIITKTPYRISFFGGGSDYPNWFNKLHFQANRRKVLFNLNFID